MSKKRKLPRDNCIDLTHIPSTPPTKRKKRLLNDFHNNKKVLILCQRKSGSVVKFNSVSKSQKVVDIQTSVVEPLEQYITTLFPPHTLFQFDYMSDLADYPFDIENKVDYNMTLERSDFRAKQFINKNNKSYDVVVLNTCPYIAMNYEVISSILVDNGLLIFTILPKQLFLSKNKEIDSLNNKINDYFTKIDNSYIYRKKLPTISRKTLRKKARQFLSQTNHEICNNNHPIVIIPIVIIKH